jgi:hypothetical protein
MKRLIYATAIFIVSFAGCSAPQTASNANQSKTPETKIRFADATAASGVNFQHVPTRTAEKLMPETIAAGVAVADFNRDGSPDIVLVNSGAIGAPERAADARNRFYLNDGKGKFTDKTEEWNLPSAGYGMGAAIGDFDNDGWTDLFLTSYEGDNRLIRNNGGQNFADVTEQSGMKSDGKWATSAGFGDFDADGDLDLFVVRYVNYDKNSAKTYHNRILVYSTPINFDAIPDQLWRNDGNGKFTEVSQTNGLTDKSGKGLALAIGDIDLDGDVDAYVANDTSPSSLWLNDGKGNFKDVAPLAGVAYSEVGKEQGSMGADFSDSDNNNLLDITVTNFQDETTSIYSQTQPMLFLETADAVGIGATSRARLKFGVDFFDADNDGDEDLLVANGHIEDNIEQNSDTVTFAQQNSLYENTGAGKFSDVSNSAGEALLDKQVSRGLATADFDADGDLDFIVSNNGGKAQIGFNDSTMKGNFAVLWLEGAANKSAIGTRIVARIGDRKIQRQVMGAQSYLSVSDLRVHFGLGEAQAIDELTIYWAGGNRQTINNLAAGKFYFVRENQAPISFIPGEKQIQ